jgi:hypothetical protein
VAKSSKEAADAFVSSCNAQIPIVLHDDDAKNSASLEQKTFSLVFYIPDFGLHIDF